MRDIPIEDLSAEAARLEIVAVFEAAAARPALQGARSSP
jgi:hypothetical protein